MKTIIAYVLTCLSVVAAGTNDVQVVTTTHTNAQTGVLISIETFTRGGQTNLLRETRTRADAFVDRKQTFYHDGSRLGGFVTYPHGSTFFSAAGASCYLTVNYDASSGIQAAWIMSSNLVMVDAFACTNGIFCPKDSAFIQSVASRSNGSPH